MQTITYHLDAFDGPLDLLLQLISKNKVNIYDIPIAEILEQYNAALEAMNIQDLDLLSVTFKDNFDIIHYNSSFPMTNSCKLSLTINTDKLCPIKHLKTDFYTYKSIGITTSQNIFWEVVGLILFQ